MNRNDRRVAIAAVCVGVLALVGIWIGGDNPPTRTQGDEETRDSSYSREPRFSRGSSGSRDSSNNYYAVESRDDTECKGHRTEYLQHVHHKGLTE